MHSRTAISALRMLIRQPTCSSSVIVPHSGLRTARCLSTRQSPTLSKTRSNPTNPTVLIQQTSTRTFTASSLHHNDSTPLGTVASGAAGTSTDTHLPSALTAPSHLSSAESSIFSKLSAALSPTKLSVQDISGGCGSMYGIEVYSEKFRGLGLLKQQRLVNEVLREEVKGWHGVQLRTGVPEQGESS